MITAFATTEQAVEAMRLGAYDYIQKPFKNSELLAQVEKALEKSSIVLENRALRAQVKSHFRVGDLIGKGPRMHGRDGPGAARGERPLERAHHRRERHRQGAGGARAARGGRARRPALHRGQLRRPPRER